MEIPAAVSDALGFPIQSLAEQEADRAANGFSAIEFRPDPSVPEFVQVHAGSRKEMLRYAKHRGFVDQGKSSSVYLSEEDFARAREMVGRRFGETSEK